MSFPSFSLRRATSDRKSTRLNSSHITISYAVLCLKKKKHGDSGAASRPARYTPPAAAFEPVELAEGVVRRELLDRHAQHPGCRPLDGLFFFYGYGHHRDLHSFPPRRSSD